MSQEFKVQFEAAQYLLANKILVVDSGDVSRATMVRSLLEMGAPKGNVFSTRSFTKAEDYIRENKPPMIITEHHLDDHYGLDLFKQQKVHFPKTHQRIFMMVTSNASESTVAEAAEEDVDAYLLKPFSVATFKDRLHQTILGKIEPTEYRQTIEAGKDFIENQMIPEAAKTFVMAKLLDDRPALACYYYGLTSRLMNSPDQALKEFGEGLTYNPIHYKCLIGEFETLDELGNKEEAYKVVKTILENFPVSPQRLGRIFTLAVHTHHFTDIKKLYELYKKLDRRPPELIKIVSAGLMVFGKFLLQKGETQEALSFFIRAAEASGLEHQLIDRMAGHLTQASAWHEVLTLLKIYPQDYRDSPRYLRYQFEAQSHIKPPKEIIAIGEDYIKNNKADEYIYSTTIKLLIKAGQSKVAEKLAYQALQDLAEEHRQTFKDLLEVIEKIA